MTTASSHPILYSYRRCPYAMRGRLALAFAGIEFEVREISFKNKPKHMLELSPKGTVPVLSLESGVVIDESRDVVEYAVTEATSNCFGMLTDDQIKEGEALYKELHDSFIGALNRYKYPERFLDDADVQKNGPEHYRVICEVFITKMNKRLKKIPFLLGAELTKYDVLIFPLIRQFRVVDTGWFDAICECDHLKKWLTWFFKNPVYKAIMEKIPLFDEDQPENPVMMTISK